MINAGIEFAGFDGFQGFNPETQMWEGMTSTIHYPDDQNFTDNPPSEGDYIIEPNGEVWLIRNVEVIDAGRAQVRFSLARHRTPADGGNGPGVGATLRGGILTPKGDFFAAHWDTLLVDPNVGRVANYLTMEHLSALWDGDIDLNTSD